MPGVEASISPRFPLAAEVPFADFNERHARRSCYIIGRGPTDFDYAKLAQVDDPIFFINDAVCLEKYTRSETYFFAHDAQMLVWLNGKIRSTAVLPIDGKVFRETPGISLGHAGKVVFYHWREREKEALLTMNREQIAQIKQLYTHTGTIHSVLHFVWYCGFSRVIFVGCSGVGTYDPRLVNLSRSTANVNYGSILKAQNILTTLFGLEAVYVGK